MNLDRRSFLQTGAALAAGQFVKAAPGERITVGHIGAGARAHELMQAVMANPNTEIVGVVDAYTGRVERAIDRTNGRAKAYRTHHDLLADKSIDAVVIATPDHWHKQIILEALRRARRRDGISSGEACGGVGPESWRVIDTRLGSQMGVSRQVALPA